ncbi:MAG: exodeoxyribonuclease III [Treponema sp.]|nr:exodeoxyribonuclease III [Treponema sp.]
MKIISWNVNGIRAIEKKDFVLLLNDFNADVVCIQETKANPTQLSDNLLAPPIFENGNAAEGSWFSFWSSAKKPGYSGTAIYSKMKPDKVELMNVSEFDDEGRTLVAHYGNIIIISAYFPNSQDAGKRLDYKLAYCDAMLKMCNEFVEQGKNIVLSGDYNIAHKSIDLANPVANEGNAGYLPEERAWMDKWISSGYVDTFREFCKERNQYTWWSYRFRSRERNIGWRIDYQCVNKSFLPKIKNSSILSSVLGSDHCPIMIEF